jgi:hypothetical protein
LRDEPGVVEFAFSFSDRKVETKVETSQTPAAAQDELSSGPSKKAFPSLFSHYKKMINSSLLIRKPTL